MSFKFISNASTSTLTGTWIRRVSRLKAQGNWNDYIIPFGEPQFLAPPSLVSHGMGEPSQQEPSPLACAARRRF